MKKNNTNVHEMSRRDAARFIDEMRILALKMKLHPGKFTGTDDVRLQIEASMKRIGLPEYKQCSGDAHSNPFIDNCGVCMNAHWGFSGKNVKVK